MLTKPPKTGCIMESETYDALHSFASKRVGSADAADLVQEAYLRFLQMQDNQTVREPRAFLFRIVANLGIDLWRKEKHRGQWSVPDADLDFDAFAGSQATPETEVHQTDQVERLLAVLEELPEEQRFAFVLNKFEGMTQAEIGKQFGVPEKTIQRRIAAVVAHCAEHLGYHDD